MGRIADILRHCSANHDRSDRRFSRRAPALHARLQLEPLESRRLLAFTSTVAGSTATLVGDGGSDTFVVDSSGGLLRHNRSGDAGFNSAFDWDSATPGDQT